jgi:RHS repeat-associated protein
MKHLRLGWIDELAASLSHRLMFARVAGSVNQIGLILGSDKSERGIRQKPKCELSLSLWADLMRVRSPEGTQFTLNSDKLYRLSSVRDQNNALIEGFTYDATGNRLSKQLGANAPVNYSYAATDHKLSNAGTGARSFDANGNTTQIPGTGTMAYDERNRLNSVVGTATRTSKYNARGERALSTVAAVNTLTVFSESGQLLSEGPAASTSSAVIYLDSMPVARVKAGVINPIEADHLGSPRVMQNTAGSSAVWNWNLLANTASGSNAFGEQAATGTVTDFNLRFPGQYSDGNGLSYNYFRDYEAGTGRYVESDPIGLDGGISTFGYVDADPITEFDRLGLAKNKIDPSRQRWAACSANDNAECRQICGARGVSSCRRRWISLPMIGANGDIVRGWVPKDLSCSCRDDQCPGECVPQELPAVAPQMGIGTRILLFCAAVVFTNN